MDKPPRWTPEDWLAALSIGAVSVITFANVLVRYFTNRSFAWSEEVSLFLLVLMTLFGSAAAVVRGSHVRVEYVALRGSPRRRHIIEAGIALLTAAFFLGLAVLATNMVWEDFRYQETSSGLGVPRWWYTVWLPPLLALIALRALAAFKNRLFRP